MHTAASVLMHSSFISNQPHQVQERIKKLYYQEDNNELHFVL